ncbi:hypothetical protein F5146DRAFT_1054266 [Armillaria mellea]|nr:hypothetical protein F5146DRAFT_1054266 [Armillaria mellea]
MGVIGFLLLLLLAVALYRRLHRKRSCGRLHSPNGTFSYLEIRPPSQAQLSDTMQRLRVDAAPVSTISPATLSAVEEGVHEIDSPTDGRETVMDMRRISVTSDINLPAPSIFEGFSPQSVQSLEGERPVSQPNTPALQSHVEKDEMAGEIAGFRTQIHDRTSLWEQDSETEPPPAYVRDA